LPHYKEVSCNGVWFPLFVEESPDPSGVFHRREIAVVELEITEPRAAEARFGQLPDIPLKRGGELLACEARVGVGQAVDGLALTLDRLQSQVKEDQSGSCYGEHVYCQRPQVTTTQQALHGHLALFVSIKLITVSARGGSSAK
jgi:hypothetical protein